MDLKKIAIQLSKADQARSALNKNQLIELTTCFDVITHNKTNVKYAPFDLDQIEGVLLDTCFISVNADLLYIFYKLGKANEYLRISEDDLLIGINIEQIKKDISSYDCFDLFDISRKHSNYGFMYFQEFFKDVLKFDFKSGINTVNIPDWILDIPVTSEDFIKVNQSLVNFTYLKSNDVLYTLSKQVRDHKNIYYFNKYTKNNGEFSVCLDSVQGGLISRHCGTNCVKRCKSLDKQLQEIIIAFECEQDRQKSVLEQASKERAKNKKLA